MQREEGNIRLCSKLSETNLKIKIEKIYNQNKKFKEMVQRFHTWLETKIVQCSVCFEAWPLSASTKSLKVSEYTCVRCKKDRKFANKFSKENQNDPKWTTKSFEKFNASWGNVDLKSIPSYADLYKTYRRSTCL